MKNDYLKKILFEEFETHENYENIVQDLRSLNSLNEITDKEYDFILENYNEWLKEWENNEK